MLLILEDNAQRINEMVTQLEGISTNYKIVKTSYEFITLFEQISANITVISLDHDLDRQSPSDPDPGDGRMVAKWLSGQKYRPKVLIHTSNATCGDSMYFELKDSGFVVDRIDPYDDVIWIKKSWIPRIKLLLRDA